MTTTPSADPHLTVRPIICLSDPAVHPVLPFILFWFILSVSRHSDGHKMMVPGGSSNIVVDEMFPDRMDGPYGHVLDVEDVSGPSNMMDMTQEKMVHTDFFNGFDDLFDEENLVTG